MIPADRAMAVLLAVAPWAAIAGGVWLVLVGLNAAAIAWVTRREA